MLTELKNKSKRLWNYNLNVNVKVSKLVKVLIPIATFYSAYKILASVTIVYKFHGYQRATGLFNHVKIWWLSETGYEEWAVRWIIGNFYVPLVASILLFIGTGIYIGYMWTKR